MRRLFLSLGTCVLLLGAVWAQSTGDGGMPELPVGQTSRQFEYPDYENGQLKAKFYATEATGITLNRAEAKNVRIEVYDNGAVTTTITSPDADLYVREQKMRTKNTVEIDRADMVATSQDCDFDRKAKIYVLRNNVKVVLKHFDISMTPASGSAPATKPAAAAPATAPAPTPPPPAQNDESLLTTPGTYSDTNSAPIPPSNPDSK
jgi:hypothetical protein